MPRPRRLPLRFELLEDRLAPTIRLDLTFSGDGLLPLGVAAGDGPAVAVQADGRILVSTVTERVSVFGVTTVYRLNPDGTADTTFGDGGRVTLGPSGGFPVIAAAPDGAIYVGASVGTPADLDLGVYRLNPDGSLDTAFGTDGLAVVDVAPEPPPDDDLPYFSVDRLGGITVRPDGKLLLFATTAGIPSPAGNEAGFAVVRLNPDGSPDPTFGTDGRVRLTDGRGVSVHEFSIDHAVAADGRILVLGGRNNFSDPQEVRLFRLTPDGSLNPTFDGDGVWEVGQPGAPDLTPDAVAVQPDGKVILFGPGAWPAGSESQSLLVARLNPDGSPDTAFGSGGVAYASPGRTSDAGGRLILLPDGRILTGGNDFSSPQLAILNPDGSFGSSPPVPNPNNPPGGDFTFEDVAAGPGGRVVLVGSARGPASDSPAVLGVVVYTGPRPAVPPLTQPLAVGGWPDGTVQLFAEAQQSGFYEKVQTVSAFPDAVTVRAVVADVNGDGVLDHVYGVGPGGGSRVRVTFGVPDGVGPVALPPPPVEFQAFEPSFTGGVFVAAADLDGDGKAEVVVTPDEGGSGRVSIYSIDPSGEITQRDNFFGIADANFRGGARPAVGDVNGDGRPEVIVAAGFGGGPRVAIFDGRQLLANRVEPGRLANDFFAFPGADAERLRNGAYIAAADLTNDGKAELIFGGGPGGGPRVYVLNGALLAAGDYATAYAFPVANFFAGDSASRGGVRVAVKDNDGDGWADVVTGSGEGLPGRVRVYDGGSFYAGSPLRSTPLDHELNLGSEVPGGVFVG